MYLAVGASLRSVAETFRKFSELPEEAIGAIIDNYETAVDLRELGRIINYGAVYTNKMLEARPGEMGRHVGKFLASLDNEELAAAGKAVFLELKDFVLDDPAVSAALEPEAIGERINEGLALFNRFCWENPQLIGEKAARVLAVVDMDQVILAAKEAASATFIALLKNPDVIKKAMKPLAKPAAIAAGVASVAMSGLVAGVLILRRRRR
jgi:hypothetical protein